MLLRPAGTCTCVVAAACIGLVGEAPAARGHSLTRCCGRLYQAMGSVSCGPGALASAAAAGGFQGRRVRLWCRGTPNVWRAPLRENKKHCALFPVLVRSRGCRLTAVPSPTHTLGLTAFISVTSHPTPQATYVGSSLFMHFKLGPGMLLTLYHSRFHLFLLFLVFLP